MPLPVVAIVGRPNVGKSSLFNWLVGRRISIVDPTAGVTRDRVSSIVEAGGRFFDLTDTGGIGMVDSQDLSEDVERQIQLAIDQAGVIVFVTDARSGPVALDQAVADRLRPLAKPTICAVNKCDTDALALQAADFHRFGYQPVIAVSAEQDRGRDKLLAEVVKLLPAPTDRAPPAEVALKLAIVGRRNAGKSTFINALAQAERVIVSEVPGTTRDSVDVRFERDGKTFEAIDTAGVRHRSSLAGDIEFYSLARAERSIRRADVVMLFFDASRSIGRIDKQLTEYLLEHHKPAIFVFNKWDLLKAQVSTEEFAEYVKKTFPMLDFVPMAFVTAKDGKNVYRVLNLAQQLAKQARQRVSTGELNRVLRHALEQNPPSQKGKRLPKVFFASQVATEPPTIVLFTNGPELFDDVYRRYLLKHFRDQLPFAEIPIKLDFRSRHSGKGGGEAGDEPEEAADAPEPKPKAKPSPKPRKPGRKKKGEKSELWDV
ncbi:MAG TPA: ribosome biogenesis GTPase Der [Gemmataceae bacterium]|nr:ribosome biogenesis GTPase Der [Gemmataceae bacterium]